MARPEKNAPERADDAPDALPDDGYGAPPELGDEARRDAEELSEAGAPAVRPALPRTGALRVALALGAVLVVGAALLVYRAHHRRATLDAGLAEAGRLLALDTAAGYREAASKLEPLSALDPLGAASLRAYALGMLFADYRDTSAEKEAEALLVEPFRAPEVPKEASLAAAALALGRREAGNALTAALRAGEVPTALALQARVAIYARNLQAAEEPAAAAAQAGLPAGLALHAELLRRGRRDALGAKDAYERALAASPTHPRAAYGLAKLAHAGAVLPALAAAPLERILADRAGTPAPERARAALHLAALRARADDGAGARAALDAAGLDPRARAWADRAVAVLAAHRGVYRAVSGAPASIQSASDDDPAELAPVPPEPAKPAPAAVKPARRTSPSPAAKRTTTRAATAVRKAPAKTPAKKPARAPRASTTTRR